MPALVEKAPVTTNSFLHQQCLSLLGRKKTLTLDIKDPQDELLDMLESGYARESITKECLSPRDSPEGFSRFVFKRVGKKIMELYTDKGNAAVDRFLLGAKRVGDTFYISPYRIEEGDENAVPSRVCAQLKKVPLVKGFCYQLRLNACKGYKYHVYENVCDGHDTDEVIASIFHKVVFDRDADMTLRSVTMNLQEASTAGSIWDIPAAIPAAQDNQEQRESGPLQLVTKLPKWIPRTQQLMQKFNGKRVRGSSSKNIILTADRNKEPDDQRIAMQFGKNRKGFYVLDHTDPLTPLQGFAVGLSMCAWIGEDEQA
jgi:hypothetical protein